MVICVRPWALVDVIESTPAIVENCFSSGVATADAIVSGLAPGRLAVTWMVGKSTFGRSLTGRKRYAIRPKTTMPAMISVVMTGRRMNSSGFTWWHSQCWWRSWYWRSRGSRRSAPGGRLDLDADAGDQPELTVGDHALARLDALC